MFSIKRIIPILLSITFISCSKDNPTSPNNNNGNNYGDLPTLHSTIIQCHPDSSPILKVALKQGDNYLNDYVVTINGIEVDTSSAMGIPGYISNVPITQGTICTLIAQKGDTTLTETTTLPYSFSVISPENGEEYQTLSPLNISWGISMGCDGYIYKLSNQADDAGGLQGKEKDRAQPGDADSGYR